MIALDAFKKLLGPEGQMLTNEEVEELRRIEYQLADVLFETWRVKVEQERKLNEPAKNGDVP